MSQEYALAQPIHSALPPSGGEDGMVKFVVWFTDPDATERPLVGGKVAGLAEMLRYQVRVPPGFAVSSRAYECFLLESGLEPEIRRTLDGLDIHNATAVDESSRHLRHLIAERALPPPVAEEVDRAYAALGERLGIQDPPVAVRSSSTAEDTEAASFAGEYESYLWVQGSQAVRRYVRACWASLFTPRAIVYRAERGISHREARMAVAVQKMVRATVGGVMFTLNPLNGDPSKIVIEGSWGLGSAVVGGEVNPDHFVVDKVGLASLESRISRKALQHVPAPHGGVASAPVPRELEEVPCLQDHEVIELARLGKQVERYYDHPQDLEWAVDADLPFPENIFLVQCRPETVWSRRRVGPVFDPQKGVLDWIVETLKKGR